ncbi:MAG: preprotein translocase subunit SecE [Candidatus Velthaea sp.]|jgi:preprotein translocase subunit SecE
MKPTIKSGKPSAQRPAQQRPGAAATTTTARSARNTNAIEFVKSVGQEMKRVTWPSREEWVTATLLTIGLVLVVGVYTGVLDWIFRELFALVSGDKGR